MSKFAVRWRVAVCWGACVAGVLIFPAVARSLTTKDTASDSGADTVAGGQTQPNPIAVPQPTVGPVADDSQYQLGPDSQRQNGVPQGTITPYEKLDSKIYPGTKRRYSVYVPAQYDPAEPACLMVFQDGHAYENPEGQFRVPIVFDNLIHKREMPITIAVFIDPGHLKDQLPEKRDWQPDPENRSVEYDSMNNDYTKFLLEEIMPEIENEYSISGDAKRRAICGISSGGICAFTVAWNRPDKFSKVLSHVGSFVDLRGGHNYPSLIRKQKPAKAIRIFLQDGANDLDNQFGNWPLANQQMAAALKFSGYDYKFEYGEGEHSGAHGGAILPDSLRWLWRDIKVSRSKD